MLIETTGEGKSAVATPDGKSRKKKKSTFKLILKSIAMPVVYICFLMLCRVLESVALLADVSS